MWLTVLSLYVSLIYAVANLCLRVILYKILQRHEYITEQLLLCGTQQEILLKKKVGTSVWLAKEFKADVSSREHKFSLHWEIPIVIIFTIAFSQSEPKPLQCL